MLEWNDENNEGTVLSSINSLIIMSIEYMTYIQRWNGITISSGLDAPAFYLFINLFKTHEWSA